MNRETSPQLYIPAEVKQPKQPEVTPLASLKQGEVWLDLLRGQSIAPKEVLWKTGKPVFQKKETDQNPLYTKVLSTEALPQAQTWLDTIRGYLSRPEAAECEKGGMVYDEKWATKHLKLSPSKKLLALEDKEANRVFTISDGLEFGGKYRYTLIDSTDLPDNKNTKVKRVRRIRFIYDEQGKIISTSALDTQKAEKNLSKGAWGYDHQYWKACVTKNWIENDLTTQEITTLMTDLLPEMKKASPNEEATRYLRDYQNWWNATSQTVFELSRARKRGDKKQVTTLRHRLQEIKASYPGPYPKDENKEPEKHKETNTKFTEQKSTPHSRGTIPAYILNDPDFSYVYAQIKAELTKNGREEITDNKIDQKVSETYESRKAELMKENPAIRGLSKVMKK